MTIKTIIGMLGVALLGIPGPFDVSVDYINNKITIQPQESQQRETGKRKTVNYEVPFVAQAPNGNWDDPRQQDGCEETSALMVMKWFMREPLSKSTGEQKIIDISEFEKQKYGEFRDTSAKDTMNKIINDYFGHSRTALYYGITIEDIKNELRAGHLVLLPVDGTVLDNPYYNESPKQHMIVVRGFDDTTNEFITNDPGTTRGEGYKYSYEKIRNSMRDYKSGYNEEVKEEKSAMIVVGS